MMETLAAGQINEPESHDDQGLAEELESLYCHVAQLDQAGSPGEPGDDPLSGRAPEPIPPADAPLTIGRSDTIGGELPPNGSRQTLQQDQVADRLREITEAYEQIVTLWHCLPKDSSPAPPGETFSGILSGATRSAGIRDDGPSTAERFSLLRKYPRSLGGAATMVVIIFLFLSWPTLYHYDSLKIGDRLYPLRINRLTARLGYFDGRVWLDAPMPAGVAPPPAVSSPPLPTVSLSVPPKTALVPSAAGDHPAAGPPPPQQGETLRESMILPSPADPNRDRGGLPLSPLPPVASSNPPDSVTIPPDGERRYRIQIKAFRDELEARAFATSLNKKEPAVRIERALLEGSGVWHRIVLGDFKTENEALDYFKAKKAKERYPGSFIKEPQK